jgi:hypothetical protein
MKKLLIITCVIATVMLSSCGIKKGYLKFGQKPDELIATEKIKAFIKQNPHPSIVLRVPQAAGGATQSDQNSYIYTAIEKELVLAGFNLKDRGLFNQVLNSQAALDYSKITDLTGTDLILELIKVETKIPFNTNRAYTRDGTERILKNINYTRYGASIEFKLILVKNNEYGGSYAFTLTPCTEENDNCYCKVPYKFSKKFYPDFVINFCVQDKIQRNYIAPIAYETIPQDLFEIFVRNGVKKVVESIEQ